MPAKQVNTLTALMAFRDDRVFNVYATTALPATPTLLIFCCDAIDKRTLVNRGGEPLIHGKPLYFPCEPTEFEPTFSDGNNFGWLMPSAAGDCPNCHYLIVQKALKPILDWHSQPHPCPPKQALIGQFLFQHRKNYGFPRGSTADPAIVASLRKQTIDFGVAYVKANPPALYYQYLEFACSGLTCPPLPAPIFLPQLFNGFSPVYVPQPCALPGNFVCAFDTQNVIFFPHPDANIFGP